MLTLFLVWTVFGTAVSPDAPKIAGFGIGLIVTADILIGGPLTGAAMNPARHFGPAVVSGFLDNWYVYWIGPLIGATIGGLSYRYIFSSPQEREPLPGTNANPAGPGAGSTSPARATASDRTERL